VAFIRTFDLDPTGLYYINLWFAVSVHFSSFIMWFRNVVYQKTKPAATRKVIWRGNITYLDQLWLSS